MIWINWFIHTIYYMEFSTKTTQNHDSLREYIEMEVTKKSIYEGKTTLYIYLEGV